MFEDVENESKDSTLNEEADSFESNNGGGIITQSPDLGFTIMSVQSTYPTDFYEKNVIHNLFCNRFSR